MKKNLISKIQNNWLEIILILAILFLGTIILANSLYRHFNHDEFEAVHTAWKISQGQTIYTDFFQHHHPLFYYLILPFLWLTGENTTILTVLRLFMLSMLIATTYLTYKTAKELSNRTIGLISIVLLLSTLIFSNSALEIRADSSVLLLNLISFNMAIKYFKRKNNWYLYISAFLLGIAFLFSQKAVFTIAAFVLYFAYALYKKNIDRKVFLNSSLFLIFPIIVFCLLILFFGDFNKYFILNWIVNAQFTNHMSPWEGASETLKLNPVLWILFFSGIYLFIKKTRQFLLLFIILMTAASILLAQMPREQYFMPLIPFCAIVSAWTLHLLFGKRKFIMLFILIIAISYPVYKLTWDFKNDTNSKQMDIINYILSQTNPDDSVYDGNIIFNLFRNDIDYFWFSVRPKKGGLATYQKIAGYNYDIINLIENHKPVFISNYAIDEEDILSLGYLPSSYDEIFIIKK